MNRLGAEIGRLRKELGITQKQLAKLVGVSEGFIIDVESGRRILNEDLIKKFSRVLREKWESWNYMNLTKTSRNRTEMW